jgi:hypothetical protein
VEIVANVATATGATAPAASEPAKER